MTREISDEEAEKKLKELSTKKDNIEKSGNYSNYAKTQALNEIRDAQQSAKLKRLSFEERLERAKQSSRTLNTADQNRGRITYDDRFNVPRATGGQSRAFGGRTIIAGDRVINYAAARGSKKLNPLGEFLRDKKKAPAPIDIVSGPIRTASERASSREQQLKAALGEEEYNRQKQAVEAARLRRNPPKVEPAAGAEGPRIPGKPSVLKRGQTIPIGAPSAAPPVQKEQQQAKQTYQKSVTSQLNEASAKEDPTGALQSSIESFNGSITRLAEVLENHSIPETITIDFGTPTVNVNLNGAEVLRTMNASVAGIIKSEIKTAIDDYDLAKSNGSYVPGIPDMTTVNASNLG